ncbi:MAG: YcjX family protein [Paracoccaceae bacterium]
MGIADIADGIARTIESTQDSVSAYLFEPVVRLGVTGLSRSGKTVFITSLVANLLNRGRMPQLAAASEGRVLAAYLQPQPDDEVPRFDYERHLRDLTGPEPRWPESTRRISQLRLSLRVAGGGLLSGLTGPRTVHLDIVDYPGEWLLDLPLLRQSYDEWSKEAIELARSTGRENLSGEWLALTEGTAPGEKLDETAARQHSAAFTAYLRAAREAGFSACSPGRFLMPGDLAGSPALTFAPLPKPAQRKRGTLYAACERRFEAYKRIVVKPFFRNHFARIDRQIVLVDALGAIHSGPRATEDMQDAMAAVLRCFRPGANSWLSPLLGHKVEKILFAATKADHLHHAQHGKLTAIMQAMVREARDRADFRGAKTRSIAMAALRATVEQTLDHRGKKLDCVRGTLEGSGKPAALYAGELPDNPDDLLLHGGDGERWLTGDFSVMRFLPPRLGLKPGVGPPHIRLDRAMEFLIGDCLR